ncbi:unnamed protein product [Effrenium voratum]|uniref:Uncharacterized protein n=1 Tax=Effrenium voratum TaxID=2562239 RepID=A0AA36MUZ9_9DINO|nr:unnamed protein product [Effrenium voratum]
MDEVAQSARSWPLRPEPEHLFSLPFVGLVEALAQFLEQCNFRSAAAAIKAGALTETNRAVIGNKCGGSHKAQGNEKVPPFEVVLKRFRAHVDSCALLLAELEAIQPKNENNREAELLDNLLRKLMATGQCLSDEKLLNCIDNTLKSEVFPSVKEVHDKLETSDILNISDVETQRFWESIQKEMQPLPDPKSFVPEAQLAPAPAPAQAQAEVLEASSHYPPKRRDGPKEVWDADDQYHDDDDPGYRIREIYEAELLAELSHKMGSPKTTPEADELSCAVQAEGEATPANPQSPEPSGPSGDSMVEDAQTEVSLQTLGATPGSASREPRSASPTFGGAPDEPEEPTPSAARDAPSSAPKATASPAPEGVQTASDTAEADCKKPPQSPCQFKGW